jgi:thiol-disulfide isomerase/thioredoxin
VRYALHFLMIAAFTWTALAADTARPSPPFTILRTGAPPLQLSQYRGKVVALAFIHTTCTHCQQLTTELNRIAGDYANRNVQFLECAFNDDAIAAIPEFLQRFAPPFPVGYSTQAAVLSYLQYTAADPRPLYVPHMVFLDRAGVIRADYPGEGPFFSSANVNIRAQLDKMLKPATPAKKTSVTK